MEMFDIVDENGQPTGAVKERSKVHEDGDLHRTSHVWIVRDNARGGLDVLLQKRSENKDSFPGCLDISSAGHIPAGCDFIESALRELKEELGIDAMPEELEYRWTLRGHDINVFHGKTFNDNRISRVYRMKRNNLDITQIKVQKEEIQEVVWMDYAECLEAVRNNTIKSCIILEELEKIGD